MRPPEASWPSFRGFHELSLELAAEGIRRGYCSSPFMENDPLLAVVRAGPTLAARYAEVREAGRACHRTFLAHVAAQSD